MSAVAYAGRRGLLLGGIATIALLAGRPAHAISINDQVANNTPGGVANYFDSTNQYPNVVAIDIPGNGMNGGSCTGTLINARTILTAAHCFYNNSGWIGGPTAANPALQIPTVSFAPSGAFSDPNAIGVSSVNVHAGFNSVTFANDIAVISLATPVTAVAPVKFNGAIPAPGTTLTMAGYGNFGTGSNCCQQSDGNRRVATIEFGAYGSGSLIGYGSAPFLLAQFRNPLDPFGQSNPNLNIFGLKVPTSQFEGGTVSGDSGGPVFMSTPNGLVEIGELSGGANPAYPPPPLGTNCNGGLAPNPCHIGIYGDGSAWTPLALFLGWLAENNPLRQVTAATGNFSWSNPAAWVDSVPGVVSAVPNNTLGNVSDYQDDVARYYRVTLSNPGTITLDTSPTIDTLAIAGAQSGLVVPAGFTLTTVLSTTLSGGTLAMSGGVLSSPEMLINGGLLIGNGTIVAAGGNTGLCGTGVCNTGGTVMPVGTLNIQGNYTQTGGVLAYQLSPTGASGTLAVQGAANLGGTLGVTVLPGLYPISTRYAGVLTASSGVNGQFAQISPSGSIFLSVATSYNPTSVDLTVNRTPFGAVPGENGNQRAVGNALEAAYSTSLTGQQAAFYVTVLASPTINVLTELSGESNTGAERAAFQLTNEFLTLMLDPFVNGRGYASGGPGGGSALGFAPDEQTSLPPDVALAYASILNKAPPKQTFDQRWTAWGSAFGGSNSANGNAGVGSNNVTANAFGFAGGMDYHLTPTTVVGFALAGAGTNWGLANALGTGRSDAFQAGVYGIDWFGPAYLAGALAFSNHWFTTNRSVLGDQLAATFIGQSYGARIEGGYRYATRPTLGVTPYGAVQFQHFHTPAYSESQSDLTAGGFGLSYNAMNAVDVRTEVGSRFDAPTLVYGKPLVLYSRVAWAHDFVSNPSLNAAFQTLPGGSFTVNGAPIPHDSALTTAGAQLFLTPNWTLLAKFDGEFAAASQTYAGSGTLRYIW